MAEHLDVLRQYNAWRRGEDERSLDETGLTPEVIGRAIDDAIAECSKLREKLESCQRAHMALAVGIRPFLASVRPTSNYGMRQKREALEAVDAEITALSSEGRAHV